LPAIILGIIGYKIPLSFLKKWAFWIVLVNLFALFLVFLPKIGTSAGGASRWLGIGSLTLQPSEFLKITSILYLSAWIASKLSETKTEDWKSVTKKNYHNFIYIFLPFVFFLGLIAIALYLQKDASTMGIITITLLILYFSARTPLWHTLIIVLAGVSALLFMVKFEPYRLDRWLIFLHPDSDPLGKGFQLRQSLISLGSGGIFGKGLGMSTQKFGFLPQAMSDSIFAIIGEELGIIGCLILIACLILFFWLGIQISKKSNDKFSKMVAVGIVVWICLQAFVNMASVAGIFPLAGIPLPFFSYGGSHLAVELFGVGLLLNISRNPSG
jgi:cell division protein FtsW